KLLILPVTTHSPLTLDFLTFDLRLSALAFDLRLSVPRHPPVKRGAAHNQRDGHHREPTHVMPDVHLGRGSVAHSHEGFQKEPQAAPYQQPYRQARCVHAKGAGGN